MKNLFFVNRKKGLGKSIEGIFEELSRKLSEKGFNSRFIEVPVSGVSLKSIFSNTQFVSRLNGLKHITGDIHYVCISPFGKKILTIHDIGIIEQGNYLARFLKLILWLWLPSLFVKRITVVSEYTRQHIIKKIPWAKSKITVIHNPVGSHFEFSFKPFQKEYPVILHIGTNDHKNLERTATALADIPCNLIIIGKMNSNQIEHLNAIGIDYENHFDLSNEKISELYTKSDIVSFISLFEGFGMPIIEAHKTGRVVITSKCASIPEVADNAAHFVDPYNISDITAGFQKIINDDNYRAQLIEKGKKNIERFEMPVILEKYINLYKSLGLENS